MSTQALWESFFAEVRTALYRQMEQAADCPPLALRAHENVRFTPPARGQTWLRVQFGPGPLQPVGLGPQAMHRAEGVFLIDVFGPSGRGMGIVNRCLGQFEALFTPAHDLVSPAGQVVHLRRSYRSRPLPSDGSTVQVPFTVEWWADLAAYL